MTASGVVRTSRPAVRGVLFDVDGTLSDYAGAERAAILAHVGTAAPAGTAERWAALTARHYARFLAGELDFAGQRRARAEAMLTWLGREPGTAAPDWATWFEGYRARYEAALAVFDDVAGCLEAVGPVVQLAAASNSSTAYQREKLRRLGLIGWLTDVVCSAEVGVAKPHPAVFHAGCAALGLSPAEVAYVGDLLDTDAVGAAAAGLLGVWLDRTGETPDRAGASPANARHDPHHGDPIGAVRDAASGVLRITSLAELPAALGVAGRPAHVAERSRPGPPGGHRRQTARGPADLGAPPPLR